MGALTEQHGNPRGDWTEETVTIIVPREEWIAFASKVNLVCDVLATVLDAISASPFSAAIPPDVAAKVAEIARL